MQLYESLSIQYVTTGEELTGCKNAAACSLVFGPMDPVVCSGQMTLALALALRAVAGQKIVGTMRRACQAHHLRPNAAFDSMDITTFSKITEGRPVLTASFDDPTSYLFWLQVSIRHLYHIFQRRIAGKFTFYPAASEQSLSCQRVTSGEESQISRQSHHV